MRADGAARSQDVSQRSCENFDHVRIRKDLVYFFSHRERIYIGSFIKNANFPQARRRFPFPAKGAFAGY